MGSSASAEYAYSADLFPAYLKNNQHLYLYVKVWKSAVSKKKNDENEIDENGKNEIDNDNKNKNNNDNTPKGVIFLCHGFGEHILRYEHIANHFTNHGFDVIGMDHQGMGQSEAYQGTRCHVASFEDFVNDYRMMVDHFIKIEQYRKVPKFLLGHSLGGLIAAHVAFKEPTLFNGVILSAPALAADPEIATPFNLWIATNLESILPTLEVEKLKPEFISRNSNVVRHYMNDPLVYHGGLRVKFGNESLLAMNDIHSKKEKITYPVLIMHGTADRLTQISGSREFINGIKSTDKKLVELDGFYHEIMREPGYEKVLMDMLEWIENRREVVNVNI